MWRRGFSPAWLQPRLDTNASLDVYLFRLTAWYLAAALVTLLFTLVSVDLSAAQAPGAPRKPSATASAGAPSFADVSKRANDAREAGHLEEAIVLYRKALALNPRWTEGRWYLGTSYYELDRYAEAAAAFRRIVTDEPTHGAAWGFRGLCEFQLKQFEPALVSLMRARQLGLGPNKELASVVRYHTAILMTRFNQFEFAQKVLSEFAVEGNDSPKVLEALGLATLRVPQLPDELDPSRREQLLLAGGGAFYYNSRMTAAAHGRFEELLRRYPDTPNAHYAFGVVLLNEQPDRAIEEFKKELERSPTHVPAMLQLAFEYIKRSDWPSAKPWASQAVATEAESVPARQALGQVLLEMDDVNGAIEQLRAGIALSPESPILHFTLARAFRKAGQTDDADRERLEFLRLERARTGAGNSKSDTTLEASPGESPAATPPPPKP
jgi:tetratricopeptide (TPR) repeat protein